MKKIIWLGVLIVLLLGGWYLLGPLFSDDEVDEELPFNIEDLQGLEKLDDKKDAMTLDAFDAMVAIPTDEEIAKMSPEEKVTSETAMREKSVLVGDIIVNDSMEDHPEVITKEEMEEKAVDDAPVLLSSGTFTDADNFHKGSGLVKLIALPDGQTLLRLEDFEVTNGPDLFVYLVEHAAPTSSSDVKAGFVNVGRLKGNKGGQNYFLADDIDLSKYKSVVIYCRAFSVLFSPASLN